MTAILRQVEVLAPNRASGRRRADNETLLYAMLKVLETGMPWRHLEWPGNGPNYRSVHRHFMAWCRAGVFRSAYQALLRLYARKTRRGEYHCIDSSYVKSIYGVACVGRNPTDRGRNATKMSAIVTDEGMPVSLTFFPANTSDYRTVYASLDARVSRTRARIPLYADKGYYSTEVRHALWDAGYVDRVAKRRVRTHCSTNGRRGIVERFFSWLDKNRRLIVRYDATIVAYAGWSWFACCKLIGGRM